MIMVWSLILMLLFFPVLGHPLGGEAVSAAKKGDDGTILHLEQDARAHPDSAEVLMKLGWAYWRSQRMEEAYRSWSAVTKLQPRNPTVLRLLAALEVERKNYGNAADLSRQAMRLDPKEGEVPVILAKALLGQGRKEEATMVLEGVIGSAPQNTTLRFGLAELLPQIGREQEALSYLKDLVRDEPGSVSYRTARAKLLNEMGRVEEAVVDWEVLAQRRPPDPDILLQLGWAYQRIQRISDAEKIAQLLRKLDPDKPVFLRLAANVALEQGKFETAEKLARKAVALMPENADNALALAKALNGLGRHEEAIKILEKLTRDSPKDPSVRYVMADFLAETDRASEALGILNHLILTEPSNTTYRKRRAQILYDMDRVEEAIAEWRFLGEQEIPDQGALMQLGRAYLELLRLDEAWEVATRLVSIDSDNPIVRRFLAAVEIEKGNHEEAQRLIRQVLKRLPADRDSLLILCRTLINLRQDKEALDILRELVRKKKDNPGVWFQLAGLLSHLGLHEESLLYYNMLVKTDPTVVMWRRQRADALYQLGEFKEAVEEWTLLSAQKPADLKSLKALVDDAYFRQDWKELFRRIKDVSAFEPPDGLTWFRIATAYAKMGDISRALVNIDRYIEIEPVSLEGHFFKADLLEKKKDYDSAQRIYEFVLDGNPHNRKALDALANLAALRQDYAEAIRLQNLINESSTSIKGNPYLAMRESAWLAEAGKTEDAMKIIKDLTREHPLAIPSLLYHGISLVERSDSISIKQFQSQMKALKKAGYNSITVSDLDGYFHKGKKLPQKPILITFDDARTDAFQNGDPILADVGYKAVMFVHISALNKYPFHASMEELRERAASGRWEIQSHSNRGHESIQVDAAGHKGRFFANKRWIPEEERLETPAEFKGRVDFDFVEGKRLLQTAFPESNIIAFAFPYGEFGQQGAVNATEASPINQALVRKYFSFAFTQDPYGFNNIHSNPWQMRRLEVVKDMTADDLLNHLIVEEPWIKAKLLEARIWMWNNQYARSLKVLNQLEKGGIRPPELLAQKATVLEKMGQGYDARKLYAQALSLRPDEERFQRLSREADRKYGPSLDSEFESFADSDTRNSSKGLIRLGLPLRNAQIQALAGRGRYFEDGRSPFDGNDVGAGLKIYPWSTATLQGSFLRRKISGRGDVDSGFNSYRAGISLNLLTDLKFSLEGEEDQVETVSAMTAGVRRKARSAALEWNQSLDTTISLSGDSVSYNDGNLQKDIRFDMTRRLTGWLDAGYFFWYGDSEEIKTAYWTPRQLKQHMVTLALNGSRGPIRSRIGVGKGFGYEERAARNVQSIFGGIDWQIVQHVSLASNASYRRSPLYSSRQINVGINLRY
jgi:tetratricopeptide (TPR) repeat protein